MFFTDCSAGEQKTLLSPPPPTSVICAGTDKKRGGQNQSPREEVKSHTSAKTKKHYLPCDIVRIKTIRLQFFKLGRGEKKVIKHVEMAKFSKFPTPLPTRHFIGKFPKENVCINILPLSPLIRLNIFGWSLRIYLQQSVEVDRIEH